MSEKYNLKGYKGLTGIDLGVERVLANIDYTTATVDAVFAIRDANLAIRNFRKHPMAKMALNGAL
jgi:hypothetical protein